MTQPIEIRICDSKWGFGRLHTMPGSDPRISIYAKGLYSVLDWYGAYRGKAMPDLETLSTGILKKDRDQKNPPHFPHIACSVRQISRALRELEGKDHEGKIIEGSPVYLHIQYRRHKTKNERLSSIYTLYPDGKGPQAVVPT